LKYLPDVSTFLSFIGLCLLGYGLFLFDPRISFCVSGSILLVYGIVIDWLSAPKVRGVGR